LVEDPRLQLLELVSGFDAEFGDEPAAGVVVEAEGVCLPARAVEGEHQLGAWPFAQGLFVDECFQGGHELARAPCLELAFELCLERGQAQFLEPGELCLGEGLVGEPGQGRPAPELECLGGLALGDQVFEAGEVELLGLGLEPVAGCAGLDPLGSEELP